MVWTVIGKMFINQSFNKNNAVINGKTVQIYEWVCQVRFTIKKNPIRYKMQHLMKVA